MLAADNNGQEYFDRKILVERILERFESTQCVCLIGPRQVGKTTLAQEIEQSLDSAVYLNTYDERDRKRLNHIANFLQAHDQALLIIDEAQSLPSLFPALQIEIDRRDLVAAPTAGRVLLLGSASEQIIELLQPLIGRYSRIELNSLHLLEVQPDEPTAKTTIDADQDLQDIDATGLIERAPASSEDRLKTVWLRGGMPKSLCADSDELSFEWRRAYLQEYYDRNLEIAGVDFDGVTFKRLWELLGARQGSLWDESKCAGILSTKVPGLNRYLAALTQLGFIRELRPWFKNLEKTLEKRSKYYIRDSGLLHAVLNAPDLSELERKECLGASWEGFAVEQLALSCPHAQSFNFYLDDEKNEIDLVIDFAENDVWAIEIKHNDSPKLKKGNHAAAELIGATRKLIAKPGGESAMLSGGFEAMPLLSLCREAASHSA